MEEHDDRHLTLRVPRAGVALVAALLVHAVIALFMTLLPEAKKAPERIQLTFAPPPPPRAAAPSRAPPTSPAPPPRPKKRRAHHEAPPATSPVLPELPPSEEPPPERAELPMVEQSPEPAPPPAPSTWKDRLLEQLAATRPRPARVPMGELAPTFSSLDRVAFNDPRMHDEENERRMAEDFGPFFRRGLEALRGNWHPNEVLDNTEHDPTRRCGRQDRTTFAVAVLDKEGNVVDVDLKTPSGCPALDDEAVAAFKRVARFPHPPAGIFVAPDGTPTETARYPVRFIVTFEGGFQLLWH